MTRGAWVGLAAIVFMFAEPWLKRFLDHRPSERPDLRRTPTQVELIRPRRQLDRGRDLERWEGDRS